MRAWLKTQGFDRTSGDFTNRGHRTPNHMLNAIDTGVLTGSYSSAVAKAKGMEGRLRATGAFGNQLFGPGRDPVGHKDHLHIPTPGGRIKMTASLARLMGLGGAKGSMGEKEADWTADMADAAAKTAEEAERDLAARKDKLAVSDAELKIRKATTPEAKIQAEYERDILRVKQDVAGMTQDDTTRQLEKNGLLDAQITKEEKLKTLAEDQAQAKADAVSGIKAQIEALEAAYQGPAAVRALDRKNTVTDLTSKGVDAGEAGALFDRKAELEDMNAAAEDQRARLEGMADSLSQTFTGLFTDIMSGTATAEEALGRMFQGIADSFIDMVAQMLQEWIKAQIMGLFTGGMGGGGAAAAGGGGFGIAGSLVGSLFSGAGPVSFDGGGYTGSGSRSGGVDGKGGFPALLHPNETVIDHTKGQAVSGGAITSNVVVNISGGQATTTTDQPTNMSREIEGAVVAVLAKHRRPGGMLAN